MSIAFDPIETDDDRARLAALADEIWHEYWPALIGPEQTDYMVANFQSLETIERDMREHAYEYWFMRAEDDGRIVGYTGGHAEPETNRFFISKVYLQADERGKGFASKAIALSRARVRSDVSHGEQAQRPGYSRVPGQGVPNHRRG